MICDILNSPLILHVQLSEGEINQYPQSRIYKSDGTLKDTVDLTHVADGFYKSAYTFDEIGNFVVQYKVYTDDGHTTINTFYGRVSEDILIEEKNVKDAIDEININEVKIDALHVLIDNLDTRYSGYGA